MLRLPTRFFFTAVPRTSIVSWPVDEGEPITPILSVLSKVFLISSVNFYSAPCFFTNLFGIRALPGTCFPFCLPIRWTFVGLLFFLLRARRFLDVLPFCRQGKGEMALVCLENCIVIVRLLVEWLVFGGCWLLIWRSRFLEQESGCRVCSI